MAGPNLEFWVQKIVINILDPFRGIKQPLSVQDLLWRNILNYTRQYISNGADHSSIKVRMRKLCLL